MTDDEIFERIKKGVTIDLLVNKLYVSNKVLSKKRIRYRIEKLLIDKLLEVEK
jgi:hypothetical protein